MIHSLAIATMDNDENDIKAVKTQSSAISLRKSNDDTILRIRCNKTPLAPPPSIASALRKRAKCPSKTS